MTPVTAPQQGFRGGSSSQSAPEAGARDAPVRRAHLPLIALGTLIVVALGLRLVGIDFGRPYVYHPDEWVVAKPGMLMAEYNGWNPHQFLYPSALMYAMKAIAVAVHEVTGAPYAAPIAYGFDSLAYRQYFEAIPEQFDFYLAGRFLVAVIGSLTVALVFAAGRALTSSAGGLAAAAVAALAPLAVVHAHYLTTDVPSALCVALALLLTILGRDGGRLLIAAGLVAGLAASTKYNAGAVVIAPVWVALALPLPWSARLRIAVALTLAAIFGFVALTPAVLIEPGSIVEALRTQIFAYRVQSEAPLSSGAAHWLNYLWTSGLGPGFALTAAIGVVAAVGRRERTTAGILAFTIVYFVSVSIPSLRYERNLLPLIPPLAILGGVATAALIARPGRLFTAMAIALVTIGSVSAFKASVEADLALLRPDTRTVALDWINANVPAGSRIARENYTPQPSPDRFEVGTVVTLAEHPLTWYLDHEVDFIVASDYSYGYVLGPGEEFYRDLSTLPLVLDVRPGPMTSLSPRILIYDARGLTQTGSRPRT